MNSKLSSGSFFDDIFELAISALVLMHSVLTYFFNIPVTVHLGIIVISNQLDARFLLYTIISIPYMFRGTLCSSSGESIVSMQLLVYITVCR
jgi:hypothetical protein